MCFGGVVVVDVLSKQAKPSQMCQDMDDVEVDDLILRAPLGSLMMMMMTSYSLFVWSDQISRSACQGPTVDSSASYSPPRQPPPRRKKAVSLATHGTWAHGHMDRT